MLSHFILIYIYIFGIKCKNKIISKILILCNAFKFILDYLRISYINNILTNKYIILINGHIYNKKIFI